MEVVLGDGSGAELSELSMSPADSHHLLSVDADQVRVLVLSVLDCAEFNHEVRLSRVFRSVCV